MKRVCGLAILAVASAGTITFDDISFGGGSFVGETGWTLFCYDGDPDAGGSTLDITYAYTGSPEDATGVATGVSVGQGKSFSSGDLVLTMDDSANVCKLTMTDSYGDTWNGNKFASTEMGKPDGVSLTSSVSTADESVRCARAHVTRRESAVPAPHALTAAACALCALPSGTFLA